MIRVYAPASIGNVGVGFDILGLAVQPIDGSLLGDCVSIENSDIFTIKNVGFFHDQLPIQLEENIVFQCWKRFCEVSKKSSSISIQLEKNLPVSSGLGSSAASIVAALVAMNCYYDNLLDNIQLMQLMGEMEGKISGSIHFDNIAPCFSGGMRIVLPEYNDSISQIVPIFDHWVWIVAYPGIKISTIQSRSILPKQYSYADCVKHSQNLSGFIHACHTKQELLAIKCIQQDIIAEPYRSKLLPLDLSYIRSSLIEKGAISCGISGAGPTIFALCNNQSVIPDVVNWLSSFYIQNDSGFVKICSVNPDGIHIIME